MSPSKIATLIALMISGISVSAYAQIYTGEELREDAQLLPLVGTGRATSLEFSRIGRMMGYVTGIAEAHRFEQIRGTKIPKDIYTYCLPEAISVGDLTNSVKNYLEKHADSFINEAPASAVVARAFRESYPCSKMPELKER